MKHPDKRIRLIGPTGDGEWWTIRFATWILRDNRRIRFNDGDCGDTDWVNRVITINSRMRNEKKIRGTLLHEISHVTTGHNASEEFAINLEANFEKAAKTLGLE